MQKTVVRASAVLTNSYVAGNIVKSLGLVNELILIADFTKGSLTSGEIKVELSYDDTVFAREMNSSVSGGTSTITPNEFTFTTTPAVMQILIPLNGASSARISAKGTGTVTNSLLAIDAYVAKV